MYNKVHTGNGYLCKLFYWETDNIMSVIYMSDTIQMKCSKQCANEKLLADCSPIILNNECLSTLPFISGQFARKQENLSNKLCVTKHILCFSWK